MTPTLSQAAKARIEVARAGAEAALQNSITDFFNRCKQPGCVERELNRKPFSIDLVPLFQTYAAAVFRAEADEWLATTAIESHPNVARYRKRLNRLVDTVVSGIAAQNGVWWRVVEASSKTVDMGVWSSEYGEYEPKDFQHPKSTPLKGALRQCLLDAEKAAWAKLAAKGGQSPISTTVPADLDRRAEVDSYIQEVSEKTGKQITRTDIWRAAKYKSRTEFERWERNDLNRPNKAAHESFTRILSEKPHLK